MFALVLVGLAVAVWVCVQYAVDGADAMKSDQLYAVGVERGKAALAIQAAAKAANRPETADELAKIDALLADAEQARELGDKAAAREQRDARLAAAQAALTQPLPRPSRSTANLVTGQQGTPLPGPETAVTSGQHDLVLDDRARGYHSIGEFAQGVEALFTPGMRADEHIRMLAAASGMSQGVGAEGGVTVPPEFSTQLWDGLSREPDNLAGLTDQYTVTGESLTFPRERETSRADGSRDGGVLGYWVQEAQQITSSKVANLANLKLEPHELNVLIYATNKLLRNSAVALAQYIQRKGSRAISFKLNDAIVNGDGVGKPLGILTSDGLVSQAKETSQVAATIVFENVRKMRSRMHPNFMGNWLWLVNQEVPQQLETMKMVVGTGGVAVYMPASGISQDGYDRLYGRQVRVVEYCQAPGTVGDIIAWAPKSYCLGVRGTAETSFSIHLRYDYNETAFKFVFEVDGQPWVNSAVTPYKGSNTLSPMVALAARA